MRVSPGWLLFLLLTVAVLEWLVGFTPIAWSSWSRKQTVLYAVAFAGVVVWSLWNREHQ
jgi:hypothetical protein